MTTSAEYGKFTREAKIVVVDIDKTEHSKNTVRIDKEIPKNESGNWRNTMAAYSEILEIPPYSYNKIKKEALLNKVLKELSLHHYKNCLEYRKIVDAFGVNPDRIDRYYNLPFLPVRLFKDYSLKSIPDEEVFKKMTSSGTTGQVVSKIYLDKETSSYLQKTLVKIVSDFIGTKRLPMIILDCPSVFKSRESFSARGAGILGFSIFSSDRVYALDNEMNIDYAALEVFLDKYKGKTILLFGFTFIIWKYFYEEIRRSGKRLSFEYAILIHGGGWKKLLDESVSPDVFKKQLKEVCGIDKIHDYYGMVEQTGSIYMECEYGHLHASIFSDIITRRAHDFSVCDWGESGMIQVVSLLPRSYPGHSLLTEDRGIVLGEDDCLCGRKGKYFKILGRIKNAEVRGCSDTFQR